MNSTQKKTLLRPSTVSVLNWKAKAMVDGKIRISMKNVFELRGAFHPANSEVFLQSIYKYLTMPSKKNGADLQKMRCIIEELASIHGVNAKSDCMTTNAFFNFLAFALEMHPKDSICSVSIDAN